MDTSQQAIAPVTAGIDVGSGSVKAVVMEFAGGGPRVLAKVSSRIRKRDIADVVDETMAQVTAAARVPAIDYVATTGEGEDIPFATGHFYGMTTHARGALFLEPAATAVLDAGALHARAVAMDPRGKVLNYKMTSQCASGSGQFLENIARYLGVSQAEIGTLSLQADRPEKCSGICAVLAETDVINMVSRGVTTPNILRGIHESMSGRFARLLRSLEHGPVIFISGGLAGDVGLVKALADEFESLKAATGSPPRLATHPDSIFAGALGAAIWGEFRHRRLGAAGPAWRAA
ncbi:benzoyl-CoA reductase subunit D [bacterium]|nr:benzoyl-CoA reductase subunit D [Planctomycetota bacterium]MBM4129553.1 benzoyl-CoA reductase subunit D [bacterium]